MSFTPDRVRVAGQERAAPGGRPAADAEFFPALLAALSVQVFVVDPRERIRYASPVAERELGYAAGELIGKRFSWLLDPQTARPVRRSVRKSLEWHGQAGPVEVRARAADGTWRVLSATATTLPAPGRGAVVSCQDVTESRVAREALSRSEALLFQSQKGEVLGRFAGGILHDLNNVLTAVKGNAQLLQLDLAGDPVLWQEAEEINAAAERAASLARQLLGFVREQKPQMRPLELSPLLLGLRSLLNRLIGTRIEMEFELCESPIHVRGDPGQIEQVLLNLVVNARDAIAGAGRIRVATQPVTFAAKRRDLVIPLEAGDYGVLSVYDSGSGIDAETIAHIFDPFFTTKDVGQGTGIGLATVAGILRQMGGSIEVFSEPGRGAEFRVYLPRIRMSVPAAAARNPGDAPVGGTETVLVVEDDDSVRRYTEELLRRHGYDVQPAARPDEALGVALRNPGVRLLLTDLDLPGASGDDLVRALQPVITDLRVITMSGNADAEPDIRKPFDATDLLRAVRDTLDRPRRPSS